MGAWACRAGSPASPVAAHCASIISSPRSSACAGRRFASRSLRSLRRAGRINAGQRTCCCTSAQGSHLLPAALCSQLQSAVARMCVFPRRCLLLWMLHDLVRALEHGLAVVQRPFHNSEPALALPTWTHRTAVYMMVGTPCSSTVVHPDQHPAASRPPSDGLSTIGSCCQCTKSVLVTWPQHIRQAHSELPSTCW